MADGSVSHGETRLYSSRVRDGSSTRPHTPDGRIIRGRVRLSIGTFSLGGLVNDVKDASVEEERRYFTLEEANQSLPYVQRIVRDVVEAYDRWRDGVRDYEVLAAESRSDLGESEKQIALRLHVDDIARQINQYLEELNAVGCVFKGFDGGLVDFYSRLPDREICLCWKLGEPAIGYWHEVDGGFAGRQALAPELVNGIGK